MKNLILKAIPFGVAFLFSANVTAQVSSEIRDYNFGNVLTNDTCTFWVAVNDAHQYLFNQYNISTSQWTYRVRKTNVALVSGAGTTFCIYHNNDAGDPQSQCYGTSVTLSGNFVTDPGEYNTLFADFYAGPNTGTSMVTYTFFNLSNVSDSASITCIYHVTPLGISENVIDALGQPYPDPANGIFRIPVATSDRNAVLIITNTAGQEVGERISCDAAVITVDATAWAEGMYFIAMISESGEVIARTKVVRE